MGLGFAGVISSSSGGDVLGPGTHRPADHPSFCRSGRANSA
jgi:hypothetical protein